MPGSSRFVRENASPGDIGALGEQDPAHGARFRIIVPFLVGTGNEFALGIPSGNPGESVIKEKEQQLFWLGPLDGFHRVPATTILHFVFEDVPVEDPTINKRNRHLFVGIIAVLVDEMPSSTRDVLVDARNGTIPVFLFVDRSLDALPTLEPVRGAEHLSQTKKEVGSHGDEEW